MSSTCHTSLSLQGLAKVVMGDLLDRVYEKPLRHYLCPLTALNFREHCKLASTDNSTKRDAQTADKHQRPVKPHFLRNQLLERTDITLL